MALLRTILPVKMVSLSAFASLARPELPPHDTLHAIVSLAPNTNTPNSPPAHGIFELSFGAPAPSRTEPSVNGAGVIITGTKGWLSISGFKSAEGKPWNRVEVHVNGVDAPEVFESRSQGVEREVENFVKLVRGEGDSGFGTLEGTLSDVAFIESALNSNGKPATLL